MNKSNYSRRKSVSDVDGRLVDLLAQRLYEAERMIPPDPNDVAEEVQALLLPDRETIDRAVGRVLFNNANFPKRAQQYLLGEDMSLLRGLIVNAILDQT
ncbi:MAG: hypothetical protein ABWZ77_05210 [Naasia sp.]